MDLLERTWIKLGLQSRSCEGRRGRRTVAGPHLTFGGPAGHLPPCPPLFARLGSCGALHHGRGFAVHTEDDSRVEPQKRWANAVGRREWREVDGRCQLPEEQQHVRALPPPPPLLRNETLAVDNQGRGVAGAAVV